jgi:hypothetical protein
MDDFDYLDKTMMISDFYKHLADKNMLTGEDIEPMDCLIQLLERVFNKYKFDKDGNPFLSINDAGDAHNLDADQRSVLIQTEIILVRLNKYIQRIKESS